MRTLQTSMPCTGHRRWSAKAWRRKTIFRETGWYTGADGKWRFEIDDSGMQYNRRGEDAVPGQALADYLTHDELFRSYPQLRKTQLEFADMEKGVRGQYDAANDTITLSNELRDAPEDTLIHEIQHAIQRAEGFAQGANEKFWSHQLESGFDGRTQQQRREAKRIWQEYNNIRDNEPEFFDAMVELEAMAPDVPARRNQLGHAGANRGRPHRVAALRRSARGTGKAVRRHPCVGLYRPAL